MAEVNGYAPRFTHCSKSHLLNIPYRTVASAVVVPAEQPPPSTGSFKRRQSSTDESPSSKRPRHSLDRESEEQHQRDGPLNRETPPNGVAPQQLGNTRQRKSFGGKDEERKRGQRLFGAVLGTLSQSSSGTPQQRRRVDIERKQQAKRELQIQEEGEKKRRALEEVLAGRRREQEVWDAESVNGHGGSGMGGLGTYADVKNRCGFNMRMSWPWRDF